MEKLTLIDGDSLIFYSSRNTIEDSIVNLKMRIEDILENTEATQFIMCLTGGRSSFRYELYPEYKANRKKSKSPLKYIKTLKAFLIEEYNACLIQELEADDLVAYYSTALRNKHVETIIASPDKDVLHQLVGKHWNYKFEVFNRGTPEEYVEKGRWVETTQEMADRFFALQLLMGDSTDNIPGIVERTKFMKERYGLDNRKGVGQTTAEKILDVIDTSYGGQYAMEILQCYNSKYDNNEGLADYQLNRYLLQLNTHIGRYNKILEHYDISEHIQPVVKEIKVINEIDEDF